MTITKAIPKSTSYQYGEPYQLEQAEKHRHRHQNHWKPRIALAHELIDRYVLPRLSDRESGAIATLDIGCSIGTMAIEMALRGFTSYGVDFDPCALRIAHELATEENVHVEFFQGDVAEWRPEIGRPIDIAICFDIFEHLHDDEVGALLQTIRRYLSSNGSLVFYTFPQQYDHIFFGRNLFHWPLVPFKRLSPPRFERVVGAYASMLDAGLFLFTGQSHKERIKKTFHCNPTTQSRLADVLQRAGYCIEFIGTRNLYRFKPTVIRRFEGQPIAHRNLFGVAHPA